MKNNIIKLIKKKWVSYKYLFIIAFACHRNRNIKEVEKLIGEGVDLNIPCYGGLTPLIMASYYNNVEIAEFLIKKGAKLDIQSKNSNAALIIAIFCGHIEIAKLLLEAGANKNIKDSEHALYIAEKRGNQEMVELLTPKN